MRKTNHSYKSNKSNNPNKKKQMYENGFSTLDEDQDMDDGSDSQNEIEQSPDEQELDEEDNFIVDHKKKPLTPSGGSHNNLRDQQDNQKKKKQL